jgi:hypothetical protein
MKIILGVLFILLISFNLEAKEVQDDYSMICTQFKYHNSVFPIDWHKYTGHSIYLVVSGNFELWRVGIGTSASQHDHDRRIMWKQFVGKIPKFK